MMNIKRTLAWTTTALMAYIAAIPSAHAVVQESHYRAIIRAIRAAESGAAGPRLKAVQQAPQVAEIESLTLDPACAANDNWCGGTMVVSGQTITIPRNLLIDLPANRMTLRQIFDQAPAACVAAKQSGLARGDTCRNTPKGAYALMSANRDDCGKVIVADMFIQNGPEIVTGPVTFINFTDGYFRIGGTVGSDIGGTMVRINDPIGRHTIQQGKGCAAGSLNCSPDPRFTGDPDNYTSSFNNGYPLCIPSQVIAPGHAVASDANGAGDPLCPATNRGIDPVADSRRFAPLQLGDSVTVMGGTVNVGAVSFLSAHTVTINTGLTTREAADQPDYVLPVQVRWDTPAFTEGHVITFIHGNTTLPDSQQDVFALRVDPRDGTSHRDPLSSTVGNPKTTQKITGGPGGVFHISLAVHFLNGTPVPPSTSPCIHLRNAGFDACPAGGTLAEDFSILNPPSRELQFATRRTIPLAPGVFTLDIQGRHSQNGTYTMPLGANLGGLLPITAGDGNLGLGGLPFVFEGLPWTMDRRLSPSGCASTGCETSPQPLTPYPVSKFDPRATGVATIPAAAADRPLTYFTFEGGALVPHVLTFPPVDSCVLPAPGH